MNIKKNKRLIPENYLILIPVISIFILFITLCSYFLWFNLLHNYPLSSETEDWARFGDYFGGVTNSIFSFLTLLTVVITLYYQRRELYLTRKELKASRKVAYLQEEALRSQALSLDKTVFESSFKQMIDIHFKLMESYQTGHTSGSQYFNNCLAQCVLEIVKHSNNDICNNLDTRMHRHLFHLASIIDLINRYFSEGIEDRNLYVSIVYNILSKELKKYIKVAIEYDYYKSIKQQLETITNFA